MWGLTLFWQPGDAFLDGFRFRDSPNEYNGARPRSIPGMTHCSMRCGHPQDRRITIDAGAVGDTLIR